MPLRLHPDVRAADTDDGTVLLQLRTGRYWQLNNTGGYVLRELLAGDLPGEVASGLAARYHIEAELAQRDVAALIEQLCTAAPTNHARRPSTSSCPSDSACFPPARAAPDRRRRGQVRVGPSPGISGPA